MIQIYFDANIIVNTITIILIVLTITNYILSIKTNREQRKKLDELNEVLKKINIDLTEAPQ